MDLTAKDQATHGRAWGRNPWSGWRKLSCKDACTYHFICLRNSHKHVQNRRNPDTCIRNVLSTKSDLYNMTQCQIVWRTSLTSDSFINARRRPTRLLWMRKQRALGRGPCSSDLLAFFLSARYCVVSWGPSVPCRQGPVSFAIVVGIFW